MTSFALGQECAHGQLARSCDICEKDREIESLRAQVEKLEYELGESDSALQNECIKNTRLKEQLRTVAGFVEQPAIDVFEAALARIAFPLRTD